MRFARNFGATEQDLWDAIQKTPDADLGGSVFKFRFARKGEGTSGGARAIVAMKCGQRVVFMYGFEKKDLVNIRKDELKAFKASAKIYLGFSDEKMSELTQQSVLIELVPESKSATGSNSRSRSWPECNGVQDGKAST
jgi:hypothetical protein